MITGVEPRSAVDPPADPLGPPPTDPPPAPAEVLFPEARRRRRLRWLRVAVVMVVVAAGLWLAEASTDHRSPTSPLAATTPFMAVPRETAGAYAAACRGVAVGSLFGLTSSGRVVDVDPTSGRVVGTLAAGAAPAGGMALDSAIRRVFVTGRGADGQPALWELGCRRTPVVAVPDATLPTVSPGGRFLAYVTVGPGGHQTGVAIARLGTGGSVTVTKRLAGAPALPVRQLSVSPGATTLAVWGGFVDRRLAKGAATTGILTTRTARSLATAEVIDTPVTSGLSLTLSPQGATQLAHRRPKGTGAALYLPNGLYVVVAGGSEIEMPFTDSGGGGDTTVVRTITGYPHDLAAGRSGRLAWVTGNTLSVATTAWDFAFGPWEMGVPYVTAVVHTVPGHYRWVAWTAGKPGAPAVDSYVPTRLPTLIGLTEHAAVAQLDQLGRASWVQGTATDPSLPPDTVVAQSPGGGTFEGSPGAVALTVTPGGSPITASRHRDGGTSAAPPG